MPLAVGPLVPGGKRSLGGSVCPDDLVWPSNFAPAEHDALVWLTDKELHGLRLADPRLPQLLHAAFEGML